MYTPASSLISPGQIGQARWSSELTKHIRGFEANQISDAYHREAPKYGLNPDLLLAQFCVETGWGTSVRWLNQNNPCGLGITSDDVPGHVFPSPLVGIIAHIHHACNYAYSLATCPVDHATTPDFRHNLFHDANPRLSHLQEPPPGRQWATGANYVGKILGVANTLLLTLPVAPGPTKETTMPKIALASGHHNSSGGDAIEKEQTGPLCAAVAKHCRALGMDVRAVQPNDGMGFIAGSLDVVGNTVVKWADSGWVPDIFLECHTEGGGGTGVFAIYPDWGTDVDTDVQKKLGPLVSKAVALATGLKLGAGGDGVMSEQQTGVGGDGFRLGIFRTTAPIAADTTRLIIEYGAHDKQPDLAIAKAPGFAEKCGKATAAAFAAFLGLPTQPNAGSVVEAPAAPVGAESVTAAINADGNAVLTINFGGKWKRLSGYVVGDAGVSGVGMDDATYHRSVRRTGFEEFIREEQQ